MVMAMRAPTACRSSWTTMSSHRSWPLPLPHRAPSSRGPSPCPPTRRTAAPWSIAWNTRASMTNGTKTLTAKAFDAVGNVTTSAVRTVTVNNDWVSPTVNITSPANGSTISGQTQVAVTATDNRAVTRVELLVDWVQVQTQTTAPYVFTLDGTTLAPGVHGLSARAFDAAGQSWMQSVNVTVQIDSTPPEVTLTAPAP